MFKCIYVDNCNGEYKATLVNLPDDQLPDNEVVIDIEWSTLNYKDALAVTGKGKVIRNFPMVPGIDLAGRVVSSRHNDFQKDDRVLVNGWGIGEDYWGGLSQKACVPGDWLTKIPASISTQDAMMLGTAGYTAMLCVMALEQHGAAPGKGPVLVTGASGGVGSVAIMILSHLGYQVEALTGKTQEVNYFKDLGATKVINRDELSNPGRPLNKKRWSFAIDTLGSYTLANVCSHIADNGAVAACGLAQGMDFPSSVAPFILRGISLLGINSVTRHHSDRNIAWSRLAQEINFDQLRQICTCINLEQVISKSHGIIEGSSKGRYVVDLKNDERPVESSS